MLKTISMIAAAALFAAGAGYGAQSSQSNQKIVIPVTKTAPVDGRAMYVNYCAPCHGADGKGNGPVAPALRQQPVDLTLLGRGNGGKFPVMHIDAVLQGGSTIPSHGTREMPVWGPIFATMDRGAYQEKTIRINHLTAYLRSMQTP